MNELERYATGKAMSVYASGGFVQALGSALLKADPRYADRLRDAFPEIFVKYGPGTPFYARAARPFMHGVPVTDPTSWPPLQAP